MALNWLSQLIRYTKFIILALFSFYCCATNEQLISWFLILKFKILTSLKITICKRNWFFKDLIEIFNFRRFPVELQLRPTKDNFESDHLSPTQQTGIFTLPHVLTWPARRPAVNGHEQSAVRLQVTGFEPLIATLDS